MKVFKRRFLRRSSAGLLLLAAGLPCAAQTSLPAAQPSPLPAQPPPSSAGIFPLAQIAPGRHGVAYTVFAGTEPEPMGVEILGLLHNALGPGQDMILARLTGAKAEYTGVVAGMSGSPVYIDGKLAGALAFRIGQFSKEPIAGITPIERMLEVRDLPPGPAGPEQANPMPYAGAGVTTSIGQTSPTGAGATTATDETLAAGEAPAADGYMIRPIETPLVFSGFSPAALDLWRQHSPVPGLEPFAGLGGGSLRASSFNPSASTASVSNAAAAGGSHGPSSDPHPQQPEPIVPGSAVSALLVEGDLEIAATCTVTYIDTRHLLACGHPITQFGQVSLPMTKATVVATLPSPLNAFKIVNTTDQIGSFTEDRQSAIGGILDEPARMIPVTIHLTEAGKPEHTLHLRVVDQPQITPTAVLVSVFQSLSETNAYAAEDSYRLSGAIRIAGYPPVAWNSLAVPSEQGAANLMAALEVGTRFSRLYDNAGRRAPIASVELAIERLPERLTAQLESAEADRTEVRAGQSLTLYASLRPWRGAVRSVPITVTLPASLPEGTVRLLVSDGATLDRLEQSPRGAQSLDLAGTIAQLNNAHPGDRLYVTLLPGDPQAVVDGRVLGTLPASMANIFEPLHADQRAALSGESLLELASSPTGAQLTGQQVILLRVE